MNNNNKMSMIRDLQNIAELLRVDEIDTEIKLSLEGFNNFQDCRASFKSIQPTTTKEFKALPKKQ